MTKVRRQSKIVELIKSDPIETQEDLCDRLKAAGYDVTQATISRDVRELKITKITDERGQQKYAVLDESRGRFSEKSLRTFRDGVTNIDYGMNIVVLRTFTGMAMGVASCVDALGYTEVLGCVAGVDAVICPCRAEADAIDVVNRLRAILRHGAEFDGDDFDDEEEDFPEAGSNI